MHCKTDIFSLRQETGKMHLDDMMIREPPNFGNLIISWECMFFEYQSYLGYNML